MQALQRRYPDCRFIGVGGPRMLACGFETLTPMERLSVMGFVEPLGRLPELLRLKKTLVERFRHERPAVVIGIDSPGFNLRLEQAVHDLGIPTVHYVSPSVWAWGQGRIKKIARAVDLMLTLFPFELEIYQRHQIAAVCVGHPLADQIDVNADQRQVKASAREQLSLAAEARIICLMPGSRMTEVSRLAPDFILAAQQSLQIDPSLHFVLPCATPSLREWLQDYLMQSSDVSSALRESITLLDGNSHTAMRAADLVLLASGTATLEAMLLQRPMIVCYKLAPLTWWLASRLVKVPNVSLPNLLARRPLVPEYLQHAVMPGTLSDEMIGFLQNPQRIDDLSQAFKEIHQSIRLDADEQAAAAIAKLINKRAG